MRHVCMIVKDSQRAIRWYQKLGFLPSADKDETWGQEQLEVTKLELIQGNWKPHMALTFQAD